VPFENFQSSKIYRKNNQKICNHIYFTLYSFLDFCKNVKIDQP
jgi:hypothetical protein